MDRVLIDAPCTGTGTWRRRPDAKWRISEKNIADRIADQDKVLDEAVNYVRPGGEIAYVTCSLLPEENTDRTRAFLQRHPEFETISLKGALEVSGGGCGPAGSLCDLEPGAGAVAAAHRKPTGSISWRSGASCKAGARRRPAAGGPKA